MSVIEQARDRLRRTDARVAGPLHDGLRAAGVGFAAVGGPLEERWHRAVDELGACIGPLDPSGTAVLSEGGVYRGTWLESTGTVSAEVLTRFAPDVARATLLQFASHQRADGLIPYKVTGDGPAFSQIQIVTPLARSVWDHYLATGRDRAFLATMYRTMAANDAWLARHRDTLGTGGVEAFCTFDTGHDLSPRFWFAPDRCHRGEASLVDPDSAVVPVVAPDLTANVACQRAYLARIAAELGEADAETWEQRAAASARALWAECWSEGDGIFYDRARDGGHVEIASDVLLRVLACEVGDDESFDRALRRYLMNTGKFLSPYGFTSLALDDPRFDHDFRRNSWGGPVNFLSLVRAPRAFEDHGHPAELGIVSAGVLGALALADRFPQCLDPWTGEAGFTDVYSPSILWFLDAIERWSGIMPQADGDVWFTGLPPTRLEHGAAAVAVAYSRVVAGARYELAADDERVEVHRDGAPWLSFPRGWRIVADHAGVPARVIGVSPGVVTGVLRSARAETTISLGPNDAVVLDGALVVESHSPGFVPPHP